MYKWIRTRTTPAANCSRMTTSCSEQVGVIFIIARDSLRNSIFESTSSDTGARRSSLVEHEFRHLGGICRKIISVICLSRFDLFFLYLFYRIGYVTRKFKKIISTRGEIVYLFMLKSVFIFLLKEDIWIVLRGLNGKEELHVDMTVCHKYGLIIYSNCLRISRLIVNILRCFFFFNENKDSELDNIVYRLSKR